MWGAGEACTELIHVLCVCRDVALSGNVQDPSVRLSLLEFSALHCPLEELEELLHAHSLVEVEVRAVVVDGLGWEEGALHHNSLYSSVCCLVC